MARQACWGDHPQGAAQTADREKRPDFPRRSPFAGLGAPFLPQGTGAGGSRLSAVALPLSRRLILWLPPENLRFPRETKYKKKKKRG